MVSTQGLRIKPPALQVRAASFDYDQRRVFEELNLELYRGEIVTLLGSSAIGKSTLLRCIAGVEQFSTGERIIEPGLRIAVQFQTPVLQPWLDVEGHLRVAKQLARSSASVEDVLQLIGLAERRTARVHALSGGMRTRLAFGRALVQSPQLLLLDEPYSSLDLVSRNSMYALLIKTVQESNVGVFFVTHDLVEALRIANRVVILHGNPARIEEIAALPGSLPRTEEQLGEHELRSALMRIRRVLGGTP